jgi:DNA-binding IclR family transcriptional regulator
VQLVETQVVDVGHDLSECARRTLESPAACRRIVLGLTNLAHAQRLPYDPRWEPTVRAIVEFVNVLANRPPRRRS